MDSFAHRPKADLRKMYPGASDEAIDFLQRTLVFNPYFRITLQDCFTHPFFTKVRKEEKEKIVGQPVTLEFEKIDLDIKTLRQLYLAEIATYHKH